VCVCTYTRSFERRRRRELRGMAGDEQRPLHIVILLLLLVCVCVCVYFLFVRAMV